MNNPDGTVFVVDDDPSVRKALARLIRAAGFDAHLFASAAEFLATTPPAGPSCLLLDLDMPKATGLDLQVELTVRDNHIPIVFLTGHGDIPSSVRAMKGGAVDFLTKPFQDTALLTAIRQAIEKDREFRLAQSRKAELKRRLNTLTPREHDVLLQVIRGLLNKQIAAELGTGEKTIKVHRARVMSKMQVSSVAELVQVTTALGIVPRPVVAGPASASPAPPARVAPAGYLA